MIKPLMRWGITLGVAGATFLSWGAIENLTAIALPEEEVLEKLAPVPVFTITDEQGAPLVVSGENDAQVAGVFISHQDAENFVNQLKTEKPELASKVSVVLVSLGEIYQLSESAKDQGNSLNFDYVPDEEAVNSAKTIGEANQQPYQGGVPLFFARGGDDKGYLTFEINSQQVIPLFFEKERLEQMVAQFKEQQPEIADSVDIEVYPLEGVIQNLETSSNEFLEKIVFIPPSESIEFMQKVSPGVFGDEQAPPQADPEAKPEADSEAEPAE
ncbi:MAG: Tic22 family protein [Cyanobacteria bacterium J06621_8]